MSQAAYVWLIDEKQKLSFLMLALSSTTISCFYQEKQEIVVELKIDMMISDEVAF